MISPREDTVNSRPEDFVIIEDEHDGVLTITLNRPHAYNAIDPDLRIALLDALARAGTSGARCIVLRGAGRGFCAGIDLKSGAAGRGEGVMDYMRTSTQAIVRAVITSSVPIITAVHGTCAGVALVFALGADYCVATDDARFGAPFVHRALVPDGAATYLLPRHVGAGRARRILLFGEDVSANEAAAIGMIGEAVPAERFDEVIADRARRLAALPSATLRYTKHMLLRSFELDLESTLFEERAGQALMTSTADYDEGVNAFLERRPPNFGATD